jgi:hypothetical protein
LSAARLSIFWFIIYDVNFFNNSIGGFFLLKVFDMHFYISKIFVSDFTI